MPEQLTGYTRSGQLLGGVREEREQCFQAVDILLLSFAAIGKICQLGSTGGFIDMPELVEVLANTIAANAYTSNNLLSRNTIPVELKNLF